MKSEPRYGSAIGLAAAGFALALLVLLSLLPASSAIMRGQLGMLFHGSAGLKAILHDLHSQETGVPKDDSERTTNAAWQHTDFDTKLVDALAPSTAPDHSARRREKLLALASAFPDKRVQVYAHVLRYESMGDVRLGRDAEVTRYMNPTSTAPMGGPGRPLDPVALSAFDNAATSAARLDSDNSYFPMMHAVALFANHKDEEGEAAIIAAAQKPRFDDYCFEESDARWRNMQRLGCPTALGRALIAYSLLFPHYSQLRAMGRLCAYLAAKHEVAGDYTRGLALRRATIVLGGRMRVQSRNYIGNLVGAAIVAIAVARPNGEMSGGLNKESWNALSSEDKAQRRLDEYCKWAESRGRAEDAQLARKEIAGAGAIKKIWEPGVDLRPMGPLQLKALTTNWKISLVLLANAILMLTLCGAALALKLAGQDRGNAPLIAIGTLVALAIVFCIQQDWATQLHDIEIIAINASSEAGAGDDSGASVNGSSFQSLKNSPMAIRTTGCVFSMIIPAVLLLILGIRRVVRRDDEYSVLARGLQVAGAVLALGLVLCYWYFASVTAANEASLNTAIDRTEQHEGRYLAELTKAKWPD